MILGNELSAIIWFLVFVVIGLFLGQILSGFGKILVTKKEYNSKMYKIMLNIFKHPEPIKLIFLFLFINLGLSYLTIPLNILVFIQRASHVVYVFMVAWIVIKFVIGLIDEYISPKTKDKKTHQIIPALRTLTIVVFLIFAVLVILSNFGYNISTLLAGLGIGGLAVALASKDLLENLISGVMLFSEKNFNVGDTISINDTFGDVYEIGLRSTKVRTFDGTLVVLPNSSIANGRFENLSFRKKRREFFTIGVVYDTSVAKLEKAKAIIKNVLKKNKKVDSENIFVSFESFNDYSLDIRIIYFIEEMNYGKFLEIKDKVNTNIKKEFEKEKIQIAFPTQTIELKK